MDLNDLFQLISEEKKRQKEESDSLISDSFENLLWNQLSEDKPLKKKKKKTVELKEESEIINSPPTIIERSLGLFSEPSNEKQGNDPLTPLDQKFVTFDELQKHYTTFLTRIQQQLSTLGGGGETNLAFMTLPVKSVTSSSYSITQRDYYIGVNYAGAVTITLPKADREGRMYIVKDERGEASKGMNRYITILPQSNDLIDNQDKAILAFDYGSLSFIWKSNAWRIV